MKTNQILFSTSLTFFYIPFYSQKYQTIFINCLFLVNAAMYAMNVSFAILGKIKDIHFKEKKYIFMILHIIFLLKAKKENNQSFEYSKLRKCYAGKFVVRILGDIIL